VESTVESLLNYFKSRAMAAQETNQVIDIHTKEVLNGNGEKRERGTGGTVESFFGWTSLEKKAFEEMMAGFTELQKAVMRIFMGFSVGVRLNTAVLYAAVGKNKILKPRGGMLITRDFMVSTINRCGMKKLYGSEGPFILKRNRPFGEKRRDDLNPLVFWIEKI
jgi:hypothetical protein